jgi:transcriptional regulator with XRE-family HTH domain
MTPLEIKCLLLTKNISQRSIAINIGKSSSAISQVINRKATSKTIAIAISQSLGLPIEAVFPEIISKDLKKIQKLLRKKN